MPKTNEELEAELSAMSAKLAAEAQERSKILEQLTGVSNKASELEKSNADLLSKIKTTEVIATEVEKLKASVANTPAPQSVKPVEDFVNTEIDSLLTDEDKVAADEAFNKLSDDHQKWVLSDKKNRAEFLSDIVGKGKAAQPRSLFQTKQKTLSIRDQIRQALNLETAEQIPPGGPGVRTPTMKKSATPTDEVVTSLSNGDVFGALKTKTKSS